MNELEKHLLSTQDQERFPQLAESLLKGWQLCISGKEQRVLCRLVEIEFYLNGEKHRDPYTHCTTPQLSSGRWALHRQGKGLRSGSYKGLDLSFGQPGSFGGVLVRSLRLPNQEVISGPSLCVDYLIETTGCKDIQSLANIIEAHSAFSPDNPLHLQIDHYSDTALLATARVGLSLKRLLAEPSMLNFILRCYRFTTAPRLSKGRVQTALSLLAMGESAEQVARQCGGALAAIRHYESWMSSPSGNLPEFKRPLNAQRLCQLWAFLKKEQEEKPEKQ